MIETDYAAHIKTRLDAAAINVMRPHKYKSKAGRPLQNPSLRLYLSDQIVVYFLCRLN
jgi:hypothetical protein